MNRLVYMAAGSALLAFSAAAQSDELRAKMKAETDAVVHMQMVGAVKGMTVKGAPYSADEISESTQILADGTRIRREHKTAVFRDSEGRVRRETPDNVTITDPVANVTYVLNPKSMTGQKLAMSGANFAFFNTSGAGGAAGMIGPAGTSTFTFTTNGDGPANIIVNGQKLDEKQVQEALAKAKASGQPVTYERTMITTAVQSAAVTAGGASAGAGPRVMMATPTMRKRAAGEPLGKQTIEGVNAEGTRNVSTIEAGAIGNDRPIQVVSESWYSEELQMPILTKHSDPRTGDDTFRVTNIRRGDPAPYLFQPPAGYQISEPQVRQKQM
jgi:hypothetical protein